MVKVMEFWGRQEGEVVPTVGDGGADQSQTVPHAGGGDVGAQDHWPDDHRQQVGELQKRRTNVWVCTSSVSWRGILQTLNASTHQVLQRMGVGGHHSNGSRPLMVLLVEMFIEVWMVEQPERGEML